MTSLFLLLLACGSEPAPEAAPAPEPAEEAAPAEDAAPSEAEVAAATEKAEAAIGQLGKTLKGRLVKTMGEEGPAAAVTVCNTEAQGLTDKVSKETGVTVGRSSLKLRNPKNAPKDWVKTWLEANEGKKAAEAEGSTEVVDGTLRVIRPIPVGPPCVACHGAEEQIPAEVTAILDEKYPEDQATGYAAGDLRGAFWAEVELGG